MPLPFAVIGNALHEKGQMFGIDSTRMIREELMKTMHKYHDNKNCERIIAALGI